VPTKPKYRSKGIAVYPSTACGIERRSDFRIRQFGELAASNMGAGVGTGDQDNESKDNGH
jgi:hypothetical protein